MRACSFTSRFLSALSSLIYLLCSHTPAIPPNLKLHRDDTQISWTLKWLSAGITKESVRGCSPECCPSRFEGALWWGFHICSRRIVAPIQLVALTPGFRTAAPLMRVKDGWSVRWGFFITIIKLYVEPFWKPSHTYYLCRPQGQGCLIIESGIVEMLI